MKKAQAVIPAPAVIPASAIVSASAVIPAKAGILQKQKKILVFASIAIWLSFSCLLTSCGFQPDRTLTSLHQTLPSIAIQATRTQDSILDQLEDSFELLDIQVLKKEALNSCFRRNDNNRGRNDNKNENNLLTLLDEKTTTQKNSIGSSQQSQSYTITYRLIYQLQNQRQKILIPPTTIQVSRQVTTNPNENIYNDHKFTDTQKILFKEAADQLLRQLASHVNL